MLGLLLLGGLASAVSATADESDQAAAIMEARARFEAAYLKGWESQNPIKVGDGCTGAWSRHRQPIMAVGARRRRGMACEWGFLCSVARAGDIRNSDAFTAFETQPAPRAAPAPRVTDQSKALYPSNPINECSP